MTKYDLTHQCVRLDLNLTYCILYGVVNFNLRYQQAFVDFQTTGLTRLNVAKNPHYTLGVLYGKILRTLQKMPEDAAYRKFTENIISDRAKTVQEVLLFKMVTIIYQS